MRRRVGQLTGGLAHDFNNLLASISGNLELMRLRTDQGRMAEIGRYIEAAMISVNRATALTHRLLAFSRRQTLDPKPIDVNRLVGDMEQLYRRTAGPGVEVEIKLATGLWPALCDPNQLENALLNLVINARDAMPDGGHLLIETANSVFPDSRGLSQGEPPGKVPAGEYMGLFVTDTGEGTASILSDCRSVPSIRSRSAASTCSLVFAAVSSRVRSATVSSNARWTRIRSTAAANKLA